MRLEITLAPKEKYFQIPINYNHQVSSEFNRIFADSNCDFSDRLPENSCRFKDRKTEKLFTFSGLINPSMHIDNHILSGWGACKMYFSSSVDENSVELFADGILKSKKIALRGGNLGSEFYINKVTNIPDPEFSNVEDFFMLSPTTISKISMLNGLRSEHFLRATDNDTRAMLAFNLRRKFEAVHSRPYEGDINIELDAKYIRERGGAEGISKLVTINEFTRDALRIRGFLCPIRIKAEPEMQKIAFECGLGERNHLGFGMLDRFYSAPKFSDIFN